MQKHYTVLCKDTWLLSVNKKNPDSKVRQLTDWRGLGNIFEEPAMVSSVRTDGRVNSQNCAHLEWRQGRSVQSGENESLLLKEVETGKVYGELGEKGKDWSGWMRQKSLGEPRSLRKIILLLKKIIFN